MVQNRYPDTLEGDAQLVRSAALGEASAWSVLYTRFHERLCGRFGPFLAGMVPTGASQVDEIAARVWYSMVKTDFALLKRFDVARGCRFTTFL